MAIPERIPVFLLSGFLGAGKSTLLNELLMDPAFSDTAVIINEFGDVPVDHLLVRQGDTDITRISTGCLCCTGSTDLRATLFDLHCAAEGGLCPAFSRVIIEMSGLGDPAPLVNSLTPGSLGSDTRRDRTVDSVFCLTGFVTLYDFVTGSMSLECHFEALKQIAFADRILLTKTDLARDPASLADLASLPSELRALNPGAVILDKHDTDIAGLFTPRHYLGVDRGEEVSGWLALEAALAAEPVQHSPPEGRNLTASRHGSGIRTFSLIRSQPIAEKRFQAFLSILQSAAGPRLLRVKGIVAIAGDPGRPRVIHAVQHVAARPVILEAWPDEDRRTRLVFITSDIDPAPVHKLFDAAIGSRSVSIGSVLANVAAFFNAAFAPLIEQFNRLSRRLS